MFYNIPVIFEKSESFMKYVRQFLIVLLISFAGEGLNRLIPLPIPGSIYGLLLMLLCLCLKLIKVEQVKEISAFLLEIMPILFIPAAAGLITMWDVLRKNLLAYLLITFVTTAAVFFVSGRVTQRLLLRQRRGEKK